MKWYALLVSALFFCGLAFPQEKTEQVTEQKPVTAEEKPAPAPEAGPSGTTAAPAPAGQPAGTQAGPAAQPAASSPAQDADITPLMKTVKLNFKEGKYDAADKAVDMALALRPNDFDAVKYKAMIALKTDKLDIAEQNFKLALTANGNDAELDFYLGGFYGKKGDFLAAEKQFLKYSQYGVLEPFRERLRKYAEYVRPKADRARARQLLQQEASLGAATPPQNSVAVVSFANTGAKKELDPLQKGLAEMLITDLSQVGRFKVIERVQMQALVDEMALGQTGLLDEKNNDRVGKLLSAEKVVSGSFASQDGQDLSLNASLSFSTTDGVIPVGNANGKLTDLFKLEKDLVFKTVKEMGVILTDAERKKIEVVPTENVLAFLAYSKGLDAEDRGDFAGAAANYAEAVKLDPGFSSARAAQTSSAAVADMGKPSTGAGGAASEAASFSGAGEMTTPVFTVGNLNFSAAATVSLYAINSVNASFMPEKAVVAGLGRAAGPGNPVTAIESSGATETNSYLDAYNVGFGSGATTIKATVPIPDDGK